MFKQQLNKLSTAFSPLISQSAQLYQESNSKLYENENTQTQFITACTAAQAVVKDYMGMAKF